jgi:NAD(P)-dependent dehydrogenase (short-subunit alcohol dehydrogenase family)
VTTSIQTPSLTVILVHLAGESRSRRTACAATLVPSMIETPANRAAYPDVVDRMVPPDRIARVIGFLCGDESAAVNGAVVPV